MNFQAPPYNPAPMQAPPVVDQTVHNQLDPNAWAQQVNLQQELQAQIDAAAMNNHLNDVYSMNNALVSQTNASETGEQEIGGFRHESIHSHISDVASMTNLTVPDIN